MEKQDEAHIGFESGAPAEVQWSEESFIRPVEPDERRSLRAYDRIIMVGVLGCTFLVCFMLGVCIRRDLENSPGVDLEEAILVGAFLSIPLLGLAHGHILKLLFIRTVRLRKGRLFEPTGSDIFVEMKDPKKGKKYNSRRKDFGLLHLRSGYLEVEMQDHRLKLSSHDISVSPGKGWESCGDHVRISCGAEPLCWEVTLLPFFQGVNIGVFGATLIGYRWLLKRIEEDVRSYEKYKYQWRYGIAVIVACLGVLHFLFPVIIWGAAGVDRIILREWEGFGIYANVIPGFILLVGFVAAFVSARKQRCYAGYVLVWALLTVAVFFIYDATNHKYYNSRGSTRGDSRCDYYNWPLYKGLVDNFRVHLIDKRGRYVLRDTRYGGPYGHFSEGLSAVGVADKCGYINKSGEFVIDPQFELARQFKEGLAIVIIDGKYGYIDVRGEYAIEPQYDNAAHFSEGLAAVEIDEKWGYVDKEGVLVIEPKFDSAGSFSEGLARVGINDKHGFAGKDGAVAVELEFDWARDFFSGVAPVKLDDEWGIVNKRGDFIVDPKLDRLEAFSEGLAKVKIDDKWGFVNTDGEIVIEAQFKDARKFSEGLAAVEIGDKWGYIDTTGEIAIEPQFAGAWDFHDGLAQVVTLNRLGYEWKCGFIDETGEFAIKPTFEWAQDFSEGLVWVETKRALGRGAAYGMVAGLGVMVYTVYRSRGKRKRALGTIVPRGK